MKRLALATGFVIVALVVSSSEHILAQTAGNVPPDAYLYNDRPPDSRFKADILLVVAHADDETLVSSYLARIIDDQNKKVAVVYMTLSEGGNNSVGPEQAVALGNIREIEARQALFALGISNVWFLGGHDLASQNVLGSLEYSGHGACLDELVRILRITRPSVVLTFLPDFTTGENHGDHQAAGVLATEAFDLAGNPTAFPEQVSPAANPDLNMNHTDGLRPWQPEKIYYFYNPEHDIFAGQGPQYSSSEISPSKHISYAMLAAHAYTHHRTQAGAATAEDIRNGTLATAQDDGAELTREPVKFIFGKSLVPSGTLDDVFAGVVSGGVVFRRAPGYTPPQESEPVLQMGDPWHFYRLFWRAHDVDHLSSIVSPEITVKVGGKLVIPLIVENPRSTPIEARISVHAPDGWTMEPIAPVSVEPRSSYYLRIRASAPTEKVRGGQEFVVSGEMADRSIGSVSLHVELSSGWVAPQ